MCASKAISDPSYVALPLVYLSFMIYITPCKTYLYTACLPRLANVLFNFLKQKAQLTIKLILDRIHEQTTYSPRTHTDLIAALTRIVMLS